MKHPLSRRLYAYWDRRRGTRPAPARAEIAPAQLGAQLVHCFLIELPAKGAAPFRFCGSSLATRYGRDLTDEDFLSLWQGPDRSTWADALAHMRRSGTGLVAGLTAETAGSGFVSFEVLLLPLGDGTMCDCAIGCMVRLGGHQETNRVKTRIVAQSLDSHRSLAARRAEPEPLRAGPASPEERRRNLVVVEGNPPERQPLTRS